MNWIIFWIITYFVLSISVVVGTIIYYIRHPDRMEKIPKRNLKIENIIYKFFKVYAYIMIVLVVFNAAIALILVIWLIIKNVIL